MLLHKPPRTAPKAFVDIDTLSLAAVPTPSVSPAPPPTSSSGSKTHAFFSSPFSISIPTPPPPLRPPEPQSASPNASPSLQQPSPQVQKRSLTADFFSTNGSAQGSSHHPKPPAPTPTKLQRHFLSLDLLRSAKHHDPLKSSHTSAPTPTTASIERAEQSFEFTHMHASPSGLPPTPSEEPTPRLPAVQPNFADSPPSSDYSFTPTPFPSEQIEEDAEAVFDEAVPEYVRESGGEPAPGMLIRSIPVSRPSSAGSPTSHDTQFAPKYSYSGSGSATPQLAYQMQSLRLMQALGEGSFSSVWLAQDLSPTPLLVRSKRSLRDLRRKESEKGRLKPSGSTASSTSSSRIMRRLRGGVSGTRPGGGDDSVPRKKYAELGLGLGLAPGGKAGRDRALSGASSVCSDGGLPSESSASHASYRSPSLTVTSDGFPTTPTSTTLSISLSRASSVSWQSDSSDHGAQGVVRIGSNGKEQKVIRKKRSSALRRLVAVKLTSRGIVEAGRCVEDDRTRVSFVREVEILKHISHPNITPLLSHLTTRTHHVLVLPYVPGGDLLGLVNSDAWTDLTERTLRRIFCELCKAVGWMHSVGLVHRDIKLENILLTGSLEEAATVDSSPGTLVKLTDFGLARFIDTSRPLLATRCGSEAYAAPELVISGGRRGVASKPHSDAQDETGGGYDARETDAWATGVVLYALIARKLPFGEGPYALVDGIGREARNGTDGYTPQERRQWLMRIARGEWAWPGTSPAGHGHGSLSSSEGAQRIVSKLLVRDPSRRARIEDLWEDRWMNLDLDEDEWEGGAEAGGEDEDARSDVAVEDDDDDERKTVEERDESVASPVSVSAFSAEGLEEEEEEEEEEDTNDDGWLVDREGIRNIARQEVQ